MAPPSVTMWPSDPRLNSISLVAAKFDISKDAAKTATMKSKYLNDLRITVVNYTTQYIMNIGYYCL